MSTGTERRADDAAAGKHTGKQAVTAKASNHNHIYLDTSSSSDDDDHSLMTLGKRSTQPASHAAAGGPTPGSSPPTASPASPASPAFPRKQRAKKAAQSGADGGPPAAADMAASAQAPGGKTAVRATKRPRKAAAAQVGMTTPAAAGHDVAPTAPADNGRPRRACAAASVPAPVVESGSDEDEDGVQATPAAAAAPADKKARKAPRKLVVMRDLVWAAVDGGTPLPALITRHDAYPHSSAPYGPGAVPLTAPAARAAAEEHNRKLQQLQQQLQAQAAAAKQLEAAAAAAAAEGEVDSGDEDEGCEDCEDEPAASGSKAGKRGKAGKALVAKKPRRAASSALPGPLPAIDHPVPSLIPNLGYACLCNSLREYDIYCSRDVNKAGMLSKGLPHMSRLALANARDLRALVAWNEAHGIRFFRVSSGVFPWMGSYELKDLPDHEEIKQALAAAGADAKRFGHRLTFHPSHFTTLASQKPGAVDNSIKELEVHSAMMDMMGFLPATPFNKINIHVGGAYGDKEEAMKRFAQVVLERLSPNCRARLTVENDDRASMFSVADLMWLHRTAGCPIVFDFHHHRFCPGGLSEEEAFKLAISTWPAGVRPVVHWSESQEGRRANAHSDYISGPINLYGLEDKVDVMIESKAKEDALLLYREAHLQGRPAVRPVAEGGSRDVAGDDD